MGTSEWRVSRSPSKFGCAHFNATHLWSVDCLCSGGLKASVSSRWRGLHRLARHCRGSSQY